uniref:hypothetical protein n=3 Tax=Pseudomonadati TaxID=3379134 RepID=UPI0040485434
MTNERRQGIYWLLTIPSNDWIPCLPEKICYIKGQKELGTETSYSHWQVLAVCSKKESLRSIKTLFGRTCHAELSRSNAASDYVWKEDTRIPGTQFEFGQLPLKRNSKRDWEKIWQLAKDGKVDEIPPDVRIQHYRTIRTISADFAVPLAMERTCHVYWGSTGLGKSREAWSKAGMDAYPKDPRTKFWDGYRGHEVVVIDEFRGGIDISHLLRWLDRYPVLVEVKGSSTVLRAKTIFITSNLSPEDWYKDLDEQTKEALLRRLEIKHFRSL